VFSFSTPATLHTIYIIIVCRAGETAPLLNGESVEMKWSRKFRLGLASIVEKYISAPCPRGSSGFRVCFLLCFSFYSLMGGFLSIPFPPLGAGLHPDSSPLWGFSPGFI
jgi:hypothetical protein